MISVPSNLSITEIKPAKAYIYATRLISGSFSVKIAAQNSLPNNLSLQRISVSPQKINLLFDSRMNHEKIKIETEPIDLQNIASNTTIDTKVVLPDGVYFPERKPPTIRVIISVKNKKL